MSRWGMAADLIKGEVLRPKLVEKILKGNKGFCISQMSSHSLNLISLCTRAGETVCNCSHGILPRSRNETITLLNKGYRQTLKSQSVVRIARFIANPFFVDI